ncbi:MAG: nuclear transport factor 2 family protein [Myxococcota bacterium]
MQDGVAALLDKQAIQELVTDYAAAIDDRDWQRLERCFVADGSALYGAAGSFQQGFPAIEALCRRVLEKLDASHHLVGNVRIELDGDEARSRCLFQAQHVRHGAEGGSLYLMGGEYHDTLRRTDDGWRIQQREIRAIWQDGNPAVLTG